MDALEYRLFYRRHLPHYQPPGATFFITFRLAGSIPAAVQRQLIAEAQALEIELARARDRGSARAEFERAEFERRRLFAKWDSALDSQPAGPRWLEHPPIAQLVQDSLHYDDRRRYRLIAWCAMPNHVHLVCQPLQDVNGDPHSLPGILHALKGATARRANRALGRQGAFWQPESYDHAVRDQSELQRIIAYVLNNPVRAGLVSQREDWPWSYCASVA
jgi:REP element-mobilizing transposase RayT